MTANSEDALRKHLDAVDRLERKFTRTKIFAALVTVFIYGSFFYLSAKGAEIHLMLTFVVLTLTMQTALVTQTLHQIVAQMTNTVLKAIELSSRDSQR